MKFQTAENRLLKATVDYLLTLNGDMSEVKQAKAREKLMRALCAWAGFMGDGADRDAIKTYLTILDGQVKRGARNG